MNWNIDADNTAPDKTYNGNGYGGSNNGIPYNASALETVLEGIGADRAVNSTGMFDVLALEELYKTPSVTLNSIVTALNTKYGTTAVPDPYAYNAVVDPVSGDGTQGGGPSGLIYNTQTVSVSGVGSVGVSSGGVSTYPRAPIRYTLQPVGYPASAQFTLYVEHAKASTGTSNETARSNELTAVRADADSLAASSHIIYTGDYNFDDFPTEPGYTTLTGTISGSSNIGKAIDAGTFTGSQAQLYEDESAQGVKYRDSLQLFNAAANSTGQTGSLPGVNYVAGSYNVFGNNGSTASDAAVNNSSNTALSDLSNRTTVLQDLTLVTDHLPVESDYVISGITAPEPALLGLLPIGAMLMRRRRHAEPPI